MKTPKELTRDLIAGRVSRREFVERAAEGAVGLAATLSALSTAAHAQDHGQQAGHAADHPHDHGADKPYDVNQTNLNPWEEWLQSEGLPLYKDYYVADLRALELQPWKRVGGKGAHIDLIGGEGVNASYVCELAPGESTNPQRYLYEEILYVLNGEGETQIWPAGGSQSRSNKVTIKWGPGSVLGPPLNYWRQHTNRGSAPARFLSVNNAPVLIDLFHNNNFVFNNDYVFRDRFDGDPKFYAGGEDSLHLKKTTSSEIKGGVYTWESGLVPNARTIGLKSVPERGWSNSRIELQLADNTMQAHISEFGVGSYKKAHRHGPGSHVVMLNGSGYTLMWKGDLRYSNASQQKRVDWIEGSLFVPPDGWFHQHFNTGRDSARYLAPTWGGDGRWFMRALGGGGRTHRLGKTSTRKGGNLIEYEDEDPQIKEIYLAELKKAGIDFRPPRSSKKGAEE